jgi:hypothetical protein
LLEANWASVYNETDANASYNNFSEILCSAYNKSFCLTRLSRKRLNDKKNGLLLHLKRAVLSKINYINDGSLPEAMKMNLNINSIAKLLDKLL